MEGEIKCCTHEDVCNSRAKKIKETWTNLINAQKELYKEHDDIVDRINSNKERIKELRKKEAGNVIEYVRGRLNRLSASRIDILLCHCQNMLNGNIDNTVLTFSEGDLEKSGGLFDEEGN